MRFELQQPCPGGQPHLPQHVLLDVDAGLLFKAEGQTGRPVVEEDRSDGKEIPLNEGSIEIRLVFPLGLESLSAAILSADLMLRVYFCHEQLKVIGVIGHQIPRIGAELVLHVPQKIGRSVKMNAPVSPQRNPQELIKTDEMVHVGMGDENEVDFQ
jgi:hypothetical protein